MTTPTQLVADAMKSVWKEKKYWLLGALIALMSPLASAVQYFQEDWIKNTDPTAIIDNQFSFKFTGLLRVWLMSHTEWAIVIGVAIALLFLAGSVISIIVQGGFIRGIQKGTALQDPLRMTWRQGKSYFWRLLLKSLFVGVGMVVVWAPVVVASFLFEDQDWGALIYILPMAILSFLLTLTIRFIDSLATPLLIAKDQGIFVSLVQSWFLLKKYWKDQLSVAILLWIAQFAVGILAAIASAGASFLILGAFSSAVKADQGPLMGLLLGLFVLVFVALSLIFQGYLSALQQIVWTRFAGEIDGQSEQRGISKRKGQ